MRTFLATPILAVLLSCGCTFASNVPNITSVSPITAQQYQTITIQGTGFGTQAPYTGDSPYISFIDSTKVWEAGYSPAANAVTLIVSSWTDSQIKLGGFSGQWGLFNWTLNVGDKVEVAVFNAQSGLGPAKWDTVVSATPEPSSMMLLGSGVLGLAAMVRRKIIT